MTAMRRAVLLFVLATATGLRADAQWSYASSTHFEVYTTGGERVARNALVYFERVHAFFIDLLKLSPASPRPTRLIVFSGDREYKPYQPNEISSAFFQPGPDRDYIVMRSLDEHAYPIVVHEYVHLAILRSRDRFPLWLNEGLAEFFATLEPISNNLISVGRVPFDRFESLKDAAELLPLTRLLTIDHDAPEYNKSAHAGTFYSGSWALVHMLMTEPAYRPKTAAFFASLDADNDASTAFQAAYGKTVAAVQQDLWLYVRKQEYLTFVASYTQPRPFDRVPVRRADSFEVGLVSANLLAVTRGRENDARAAFQKLSAERPDDVPLLESRAYFELRNDHVDAAVPSMARAVELGTTNASVYRDYGRFGQLAEPRREQLLTKAVELAPDDVEARLALAGVQRRLRKDAAAVMTLKAITHARSEDAYRVYMALALAQAAERQWADAGTAADAAVKHARTPEEATVAQNLRDSLFQASQPIVDTGRVINMVCGTGQPILELATAKGVLRLEIDAKIGPTLDLKCGPQDVPVRVSYAPTTNPTRATVGIVRTLEVLRPPPPRTRTVGGPCAWYWTARANAGG